MGEEVEGVDLEDVEEEVEEDEEGVHQEAEDKNMRNNLFLCCQWTVTLLLKYKMKTI